MFKKSETESVEIRDLQAPARALTSEELRGVEGGGGNPVITIVDETVKWVKKSINNSRSPFTILGNYIGEQWYNMLH